VPLEFEVVTDAVRPYVRITSNLSVNEPVVQVLVEVIWASGRMLREYTLFLDPPTVEAQAPPVLIKPAQVKTPPVEPRSAPVAPIQKTVEPIQETVTKEEVVASQEQPEAPVEAAQTPDSAEETPASRAQQQTDSSMDDSAPQENSGDEVYGPVARGETLWGIARDFSRGSGYSINQTMLAMQRKNPEAFIRGNINSLKRGAILRLPSFNELPGPQTEITGLPLWCK
jgi:pilus assembly protein FimV